MTFSNQFIFTQGANDYKIPYDERWQSSKVSFPTVITVDNSDLIFREKGSAMKLPPLSGKGPSPHSRISFVDIMRRSSIVAPILPNRISEMAEPEEMSRISSARKASLIG